MILSSAAALLPLTALALTSLVLLMLSAYAPRKAVTGPVAVAGLSLSFLASAAQLATAPANADSLFVFDRYTRYFLCLAAGCSAGACLLAVFYPLSANRKMAEFFTIVVTATLGAGSIVASGNFVTFFIGLEILSVSIFVLSSYFRSSRGLEAAFKYLLLSSASSTFLLFGAALLFFRSGTLDIGAMMRGGSASDLYFAGGLSLLAVGIGFKIAVVPLHMWAPDIYQGAPAPVSAFISTVSKAALFAFALRHLSVASGNTLLSPLITGVAVASMFVGNILGLLQENVKRLLAYSSIAQAGYVLVAFQAEGRDGLGAASFYLTAYFISVLGAFGVVSLLAESDRELELLSEYRGLAWRRPLMALIFAIMLLSLAGIPVTAGFVGKFYLLSAGVNANLRVLILSLVASSVIALYYYLRVIITMYDPSEEAPAVFYFRYPRAASLLLSALALLVLLLGLYPSPLLRLLKS